MDARLRQITQVLVTTALCLSPVSGVRQAAGGVDSAPRATAPVPARQLLRIEVPSVTALEHLHHLGVDILGRETAGRLRVAVREPDMERLGRLGFAPQALPSRPAVPPVLTAAPAGVGSVPSYHSYEQVVATLDALRRAYPHIVGERISLGKTWEGRDLWAVKISDRPDVDEDEPEVLFDALHHAREAASLETLLRTMFHLVAHYADDPEIRYLIDERELWFVPMVNPDGYAMNQPGGMWRKNRRPNPDGSFGVDLNRNYDCRFAHDDRGSSPDPSSQTYRGPHAFSEPETRAMRDFMLARPFVTGMTLHAFSDLNLLPGGWAPERPVRWQELCELGEDLEVLTGYPYGQPWELLYVSNGRSQDWAHEVAGILVVEPEIGQPADGFWPGAERLDELAAQNLPSMLHMARIAGAHLAVASSAIVGDSGGDGTAGPGERVSVAIGLRNKGYARARSIVATLRARTAAASVVSAEQVVGEVPARATLPATRLVFEIALAPDTVEGVPLEFDLELRGAGGYVGHDTVTLIAGRPRLVFADDAERGAAHWRTSAGWGVIELGGGERTGRAFTDSPHGSYAARSDNALELREPLDLSAFTAARLVYRERYVVEPWSDRCLVEASVDGRDWTTLATGRGGAQHRFRERHVDLGRFAGAPSLHLRFRLLANGAREKDGWTIDDIRVWGFAPEAGLAATAVPTAPDGPITLPPASTVIEAE
ncbi:MAG: M14 family zinc carboxypeptidase [Candidatus Eiseniibacteriota bacterium]|jgi:hypothetical protein